MTTSNKEAEGEVVSSHCNIKANLTAHRELNYEITEPLGP